jgi:hypothetical protein
MKKCCAVIDTIWLVSARYSVLGKISFRAFNDVNTNITLMWLGYSVFSARTAVIGKV